MLALLLALHAEVPPLLGGSVDDAIGDAFYDVGTPPEAIEAGAIPALRPWMPASLRPIAEAQAKEIAKPLGKKLELELWPVRQGDRTTFAFARYRTTKGWSWLKPSKIDAVFPAEKKGPAGDCVYSNAKGEITAAWTPDPKAKGACHALPPPARFNRSPLTFVLAIDGDQLTWPAMLEWVESPPPSVRATAALPKDALPVPLVRQAHPYSCGAAALLSVLLYWTNYDWGESSLYEALETTENDGTEPPKIAEVARQKGLRAEWKEDSSLAEVKADLKAGATVILAIQAWRSSEIPILPWSDTWEDGHYVVLVGMDDWNAYVMDPSVAATYTWLPLAELEARWHDYENRHGPEWRYQRLAITIKGQKPFKRGLVRME